MTPSEFIKKWRNVELKERTASQSHFNDICRLLEIDDPITADPKGEWFTFEKGASKTSGGDGWADVWRKERFAWEYKGKRANLDKAFDQLLQYAIALENPPLLIVSDMDVIRIHTNWTNTVQNVHTINLDDLTDASKRDLLRNAFLDPEKLKPTKTRQLVTEEAAQNFANMAQRLRKRGHDAHEVAHFVNRLVFCMFAEDVDLLPNKMFERMIKAAVPKPASFATHAKSLFGAMKTGGLVGFENVSWFNGGLFDNDDALRLEQADLDDLVKAAKLDWSDIDPSILGTLFERGLDPAKRSQLGAHYTDRDKIMQIVNPVIVEPLLAEWANIKTQIETFIDKAPKQTKAKLLRGKDLTARTKALDSAEKLHIKFIERLKSFRALDPACGSGNFLYIALLELKNIEHRVNLEAEALGLPRGFPQVGPEVVLGIELSPYAAELARVSVWIGEIQWMRRNGFEASKNPILRTLTTIENRDAVLNEDGSRAEWPKADVVIGNPPFLGAKSMNRTLGKAPTHKLRQAYSDSLPGFTDLVCYWFEKARTAIKEGRLDRAGFVATKSIAKNTNLPVMRNICEDHIIFSAFANEAWVVDGAAVRVAIICFGHPSKTPENAFLNGLEVSNINADLTSGLDKTAMVPLKENKHVAFVGIQKSGPFDIAGHMARLWLKAPLNPNGEPNKSVLRPTLNGSALTAVKTDTWLIDFPRGLSESSASLWELPFQYLKNAQYDPDDPILGSLEEFRKDVRDWQPREEWWTTYWPRPDVRLKLAQLTRYAVTPMTSEHRCFIWLELPTIPDNNTIIVARDDDTSFGVVHSFLHETWTTLVGNRMGVGNQRRYNPATVFETFPFPDGLSPNIAASDYATDPRAIKIAEAAKRLNMLRENWLNPADLVERIPEVVAGYPDRIIPKNDEAAKELKKRTLTNLYNARPAWLDHAHITLDEAVAEAYGWGDDWRDGKLVEDEILSRLFKLNQDRAKAEAKA